MATRTQTAVSRSRASRTRYATKADIEHLTASIDRIRDEHTRYLICMTLDIITQHLADQEKDETPEIRVAAN